MNRQEVKLSGLASGALTAQQETTDHEDRHTQDTPPVGGSQSGRLAYSVAEAAEALGLGLSLVKELCYTGELRSVKAGRRRIIPAAALDRFLEGRP